MVATKRVDAHQERIFYIQPQSPTKQVLWETETHISVLKYQFPSQ